MGNGGITSTCTTDNGCDNRQISFCEELVKVLQSLNVEYMFGVSGGSIFPTQLAIQKSPIKTFVFRHESGAAFAAAEAFFASHNPVVVFATLGPGMTNAITGLLAARYEGAKVILISGATSPENHGKWGLQETSPYTMPYDAFFSSGKIFHYATCITHVDQLQEVYARLQGGVQRPGGFVAHLSLSISVQKSLLTLPVKTAITHVQTPLVDKETLQGLWKLFQQGSLVIWVGFGARFAWAEITQLVKLTGAAVMCSPRAKGIFPESHFNFIGVTGYAGHRSVYTYLQRYRPYVTLVLGTRLGEFTSFWDDKLTPKWGFVHVDIDREVQGAAFPGTQTIAIQAEIKQFVKQLNYVIASDESNIVDIQQHNHVFQQGQVFPSTKGVLLSSNGSSAVRPSVLMAYIQDIVIDGSNALVMAEPGNSFGWAIQYLRFDEPDRFRTSVGFASMGHFTTGVVGAALVYKNITKGIERKVVAIVGDGAMLMNNEISTAVNYQIPAVWIVLNDGKYNMIKQGAEASGNQVEGTQIPQVDFRALAKSLGAHGVKIEQESDIVKGLRYALTCKGPVVLDVIIDPSELAPRGVHR